jgi:hypothetical protein
MITDFLPLLPLLFLSLLPFLLLLLSLLPSLLLLPLLLIRRLDDIVLEYVGDVAVAVDFDVAVDIADEAADVTVVAAAAAGDRQTFKVLLRTAAAVGNRRIIIRLYKIQ